MVYIQFFGFYLSQEPDSRYYHHKIAAKNNDRKNCITPKFIFEFDYVFRIQVKIIRPDISFVKYFFSYEDFNEPALI